VCDAGGQTKLGQHHSMNRKTCAAADYQTLTAGTASVTCATRCTLAGINLGPKLESAEGETGWSRQNRVPVFGVCLLYAMSFRGSATVCTEGSAELGDGERVAQMTTSAKLGSDNTQISGPPNACNAMCTVG